MCSFRHFGKTNDIKNIDLISSKNVQNFTLKRIL